MAAPGPEADIDRIASRVRYGPTFVSFVTKACPSNGSGSREPPL